MNYFELFELPEALRVDTVQLRKKFLLLSRQYHPDFFNSGNGMSEEENLRQSALVNEGFKVLQDEQSLLGYLLQIKGIILPNEKYQLAPDFLMEMMEINEDWDEHTSAVKIQKLQEELAEKVKPLYDKHIAEFSEADWQELKDYYFKTKYIRRLTDRSEGRAAEL